MHDDESWDPDDGQVVCQTSSFQTNQTITCTLPTIPENSTSTTRSMRLSATSQPFQQSLESSPNVIFQKKLFDNLFQEINYHLKPGNCHLMNTRKTTSTNSLKYPQFHYELTKNVHQSCDKLSVTCLKCTNQVFTSNTTPVTKVKTSMARNSKKVALGLGSITSGLTFPHLQNLMCILGLEPPKERSHRDCVKEICGVILSKFEDKMKFYQEKAVEKNGCRNLGVSLDEAWCTRGHS